MQLSGRWQHDDGVFSVSVWCQRVEKDHRDYLWMGNLQPNKKAAIEETDDGHVFQSQELLEHNQKTDTSAAHSHLQSRAKETRTGKWTIAWSRLQIACGWLKLFKNICSSPGNGDDASLDNNVDVLSYQRRKVFILAIPLPTSVSLANQLVSLSINIFIYQTSVRCRCEAK